MLETILAVSSTGEHGLDVLAGAELGVLCVVQEDSPLMPSHIDSFRQRRDDFAGRARANATLIQARKAGFEVSVKLVRGLL